MFTFRATQGHVYSGTIGCEKYGGQIMLDLGHSGDGGLDICEVYIDIPFAEQLLSDLAQSIAGAKQRADEFPPNEAPRGYGGKVA